MQEEKTAENKANYIDGGNFKARIGNNYLPCRGVLQQSKKGNNRGQNEEFNLSGSDSRTISKAVHYKNNSFFNELSFSVLTKRFLTVSLYKFSL